MNLKSLKNQKFGLPQEEECLVPLLQIYLKEKNENYFI